MQSVIEGVVFYYLEGSTADKHKWKTRFRCQLDSDVSKLTIAKLKQELCEFAGFKQVAKEQGLGDNITLKLKRESKIAGKSTCFAIDTDNQLRLELPSILTGNDTLQVLVFPVHLSFARKCPTIKINLDALDVNKSSQYPTTSGSKPVSKSRKLSQADLDRLDRDLKELDNSVVLKSTLKTSTKHRGKIIEWPWHIKCGICGSERVLDSDRGHEGRLQKFKSAHFNRCKEQSERRKQSKEKQMKVDSFLKKKRKRDSAELGDQPGSSEKKTKECLHDSDLDASDFEDRYSSDEDTKSNSTQYSSDNDTEKPDSDLDSDESSPEADEESFADESGSDSDNSQSLLIGVEQADDLCVKLNTLIQDGKIDRNGIMYKHLNGVVHSFGNQFYVWDKEVVEFFNSVTYLGGRATANFIRGPMCSGQGRFDGGSNKTPKMNLGGPSESTCARNSAGYTVDSGVIKPLSLTNLKLLQTSSTSPLVNSKSILAFPCSLGNDGTSLKPAIEFDQRLKENIGLDFKVDLTFVNSNSEPSPDTLKDKIITEALVSSVTALDNTCSSPCAVDYSTKTGKSGDGMMEMFSKQIKLLQMCSSCQLRTASKRHILQDNEDICKSHCELCYSEKKVCEDCSLLGHTSYRPGIRACDSCIQTGEQCVKRVVLVLCADCESGNKSAFDKLKESIESGDIDPYLDMLSILPDCPHLAKTLKGSMANWWLKLKCERANLTQYLSLRNRSDSLTKEKMRKLIPKNKHIKHTDRQDPQSVLTLYNKDLCKFVSDIGYVGRTIVPELDRYSELNVAGKYPYPVSVCIGSYGWLLFLSHQIKTGKCTLYKARLHCPVDNIKPIQKEIDGDDVQMKDDIIFLCEKSGRIVLVENKPGVISVKVVKEKNKAVVQNIAERLSLSTSGTVKELTSRIEKNYQTTKSLYTERGFEENIVNFWKHPKDEQPSFQAIACVSGANMYALQKNVNAIAEICLIKDGVGLRAEMSEDLIFYGPEWSCATTLCYVENQLFVSTTEGIFVIELTRKTTTTILKSSSASPRCLTPFKKGILFSDEDKFSVYRVKEDKSISLFAGTETEGNYDGPASTCQFMQPKGVCTEFDNVVYICDAQTGAIKLFSEMHECAKYFEAVGNMCRAFSLHSKGQQYTVQNMDEACSLITSCTRLLKENEEHIRAETGRKGSLNGPDGNVSARTLDAIVILEWGLRRLKSILDEQKYTSVNLLSCMTLDTEHLHSTVHRKHSTLSQLQYAQSFGATMKEDAKRLSSWAAYYHTSRKSWYPPPERATNLFSLPVMSSLPAVEMSAPNIQKLRDWAQSYGAAVRQRTNRQQTTMAKHGALPDFIYQRTLSASEKYKATCGPIEENTLSLIQDDMLSVDYEEDELFDEDSDDDSVACVDDGENTNTSGYLPQIERSTTFLIGAQSRYGRAVRFNSRLLF